MNDDAERIKAALDRRFARVAIPTWPDGTWRAATTGPVTIARSRRFSRGFAYAAALLVVVLGGLAAQAASSWKLHDLPFMRFFVSSKPLPPGIHKADRLTIAEAQRRIAFPIVVPAGLPAGTQFMYAHVVSEKPVPRVALTYQAHIASRYYRISLTESTVAVGRPVAHFALKRDSHGITMWTLPRRRFNHGAVVIDLFSYGLPDSVSDDIVRANTLR